MEAHRAPPRRPAGPGDRRSRPQQVIPHRQTTAPAGFPAGAVCMSLHLKGESPMDVTGKHYTWFQNKECEYFPCHKGVREEEFNCLFCYCPLYRMPDCRGGFVMRGGIKDCSYCLLPHNGLESYPYILAKLREENSKQ